MVNSLRQNSIVMDDSFNKLLMDQVKVKVNSIYTLRHTYQQPSRSSMKMLVYEKEDLIKRVSEKNALKQDLRCLELQLKEYEL